MYTDPVASLLRNHLDITETKPFVPILVDQTVSNLRQTDPGPTGHYGSQHRNPYPETRRTEPIDVPRRQEQPDTSTGSGYY